MDVLWITSGADIVLLQLGVVLEGVIKDGSKYPLRFAARKMWTSGLLERKLPNLLVRFTRMTEVIDRQQNVPGGGSEELMASSLETFSTGVVRTNCEL